MVFENLVDTTLWILIHYHEYGNTAFPFTADVEPKVTPALAKKLKADFEPDKKEWLELIRIENLESIPHIET